METDIQRIIADPTLSVQAKAIIVAAEIERHLRGSQNSEMALLSDDVLFHLYYAPFLPRTGELISCRLAMGTKAVTTCWQVRQVQHTITLDRLAQVILSVEPADPQTILHWQHYRDQNHTT